MEFFRFFVDIKPVFGLVRPLTENSFNKRGKLGSENGDIKYHAPFPHPSSPPPSLPSSLILRQFSAYSPPFFLLSSLTNHTHTLPLSSFPHSFPTLIFFSCLILIFSLFLNYFHCYSFFFISISSHNYIYSAAYTGFFSTPPLHSLFCVSFQKNILAEKDLIFFSDKSRNLYIRKYFESCARNSWI